MPEFASLTALFSDLPNINNVILTESAIYFTTTDYVDHTSFFRETRIFKVYLDESDITHLTSYTHLPNYSAAPPPPGAEGGGVHISAMQIDSDGSLWVAESGIFVTFDFPSDFNTNEATFNEAWEHHKPLKTTYSIRKLDSTGAEVLSLDIDPLASTTSDWIGITAFSIDDEGKIIVGSGHTIIVLDTDGSIQFTLTTEEFIYPSSLIRLSDGKIAHKSRVSRLMTQTLRIIDIHGKAWGDTIELPLSANEVFDGHDEFLVVFSDGSNLLGLDKESGEAVQILNWVASGIEPAGLDNVLFLPDDRILLTTTSRGHDETGQFSRNTELVVINRTLQDEAREKTVITMATDMPFFINTAVLHFNRTNPSYQVELVNIGAPGYMASFDEQDKFALEMIAGRGPDIVHTAWMPFHQWAARGYFTDLYEFIDADTRIERHDFVEGVLRSMEINGKLYQMSPDFYINTLIGSPDVLGSSPGWSVSDFKAVLEANPQATKPLGETLDGYIFLQMVIQQDTASFVNWETGTVYFDTDYFIELLDLAYTLSMINNIDWDEIIAGGMRPHSYRYLLSGEQIIEPVMFTELSMYSVYQDLFGGDFVFKGYPTENGSGSILGARGGVAIPAASKNQQGAWEFVRMLLSEEWQSMQFRHHEFQIPTNRNVFEQSLTEAMEPRRDPTIWINDFTGTFRPLTEDQANTLRELVDSVTSISSSLSHPLVTIILESANDFFAGTITAPDAARIIQSRAAIYVAEQS